MSIEERKARLVSIILNSDEDDLIHLLEEGVTEYSRYKQKKPSEELSPEEHDELTLLAADESPDNYITMEEFKAETDRWRSR